MVRVGYLEGTDPLFLNELVARNIDTVPLSNGVDGHGKFIGHLTKTDEIDVVVGFLHKIIPLADSGLTPLDILHSCQVHRIPVLVITQRELHGKAAAVLGKAGEFTILVDPAELRIRMDRAIGGR